MKKVLCILLVVIMMLSVFAMSANAIDREFDASKFLYFEKTVDYYDEKYIFDIMYNYNEICYHYSDENQEEPDWALLYCVIRPSPVDFKCGTVVGNRVLAIEGGACVGFTDGYGVYVKEIDSIISLSQSSLEQIVELCPDFIKVIQENEIGQAIGDVDNNGKIDVFDATSVQRYLAEYSELPYYNGVSIGGDLIVYFSDFDRDGETTIMDATAIQRHIAGLE